MPRNASSRRLAARPAASASGYAKSRETRARILAAARAEASESGFHKSSVARIAARAGVAIGSLNYHFASRDELIRELMADLMADLMARLHAADADTDPGADYFARERAALLAFLAHVREHPELVRLADEIKLHAPELYRQGVARWVARMSERLRVGIAEGTLRAMDDDEIAVQAHILLGARHFIEQMIERRGGPGDEAVVDAYLGLVRGGLARVSGSRSGRTR